MRIRPLLLACAVAVSCSPQSGLTRALSAELRLRSTVNRLGICRFLQESQIEVIFFDGTEQILTLPGIGNLYDVEETSQTLVCPLSFATQLRDRGLEGIMSGRFALLAANGKVVKTLGVSGWPWLLRISPDLSELAMLTGSGAGVSLEFGPTSWATHDTIYAVEQTTDYKPAAFAWSPDSKSLVYCLKDEIFVFDLTKRVSRKIALGSGPSWSPNGRFLAYRSKQNDISLYRFDDGKTTTATQGIKVIGVPMWSPDSSYILFTKYDASLALRNPITMPTTDFIVLRVSDGAMTTVFTPGLGADNGRFYWIQLNQQRSEQSKRQDRP